LNSKESKRFEAFFKALLRFEGGESNNAFDRGGLTKYGISFQFVKANKAKIEKVLGVKIKNIPIFIKQLSLKEAKTIYFRFFYIPSNSHLILDNKIAYYHFDTAVNSGVTQANRLLQKALNHHGFKLKVDGVIGVKTLGAINYELEDRFLFYLNHITTRSLFYTQIVIRNPKQLVFFKGWIKRAIKAYGAVK